jgi:hypothetical protein
VKLHLELTDKIALGIAAFMLIGGFAGLLLPGDFVIAHTSMAGKGVRAYTLIEHVTPATARIYGLAGIVLGAIIAVYVFWSASSE